GAVLAFDDVEPADIVTTESVLNEGGRVLVLGLPFDRVVGFEIRHIHGLDSRSHGTLDKGYAHWGIGSLEHIDAVDRAYVFPILDRIACRIFDLSPGDVA